MHQGGNHERTVSILVIIGAGPGGYSTALRAAELGMKVALVERDATVGGTCLNRGCIPSKALITATHTIDTVHRAAELGVNASVNGIDFGTLRDYRLRVVKTMVGGLAGLLAHRGITVFRANAAFHADETAPATSNHIVHLVPSPDQSDILTYHKADVPEPSGPTMDLTATNIVIATGAKPHPLPGQPVRRRPHRLHTGAGSQRISLFGGDYRRRGHRP